MNWNRRRFSKTVATSVAAAALSNKLHARQSPNETIQIGCIGTGGRCQELMRSLLQIPDVRIVAVCDIWDVRLEQANDLAGGDAFITRDYHDLLELDEVDAVVIGSPDHWHVPMTIDACNAKKDVYVEKPLTHKLSEGMAVIEAQNKNQRVVQVGMQQRSMPHIQEAYEILKSGALGDIHKVHLTWNRNVPDLRRVDRGIDPGTVDWKRFLGNAPERPFDDYILIANWRWFWDFGGGILTDLMVHYLDVAHWFMEVDHPASASTIGDHVQGEGVWEAPDCIQTLLHYPEKKLEIYFEGTFYNRRNRAMMEFMGSNATLYMDRGRYEIHPENDKGKYRELILGSGDRGADFYDNPKGELLHLQNWIEAIRARKKPNTPAEAGVSAAGAAHLGNISFRENKKAFWDEEMETNLPAQE
ncbi:MAG: Gfo/Idh/MocA family protein [bacterium]